MPPSSPFRRILSAAALCLTLAASAAGCGRPPATVVDLGQARITGMRAFVTARTTGPGGLMMPVAAGNLMPCDASRIDVEIEVRAVLHGSTREEIFTTSPADFAKRVQQQPHEYTPLGIEDGAAYAKAHTIDAKQFQLVTEGGLAARRGELAADVDLLSGAFLGHSMTVRSPRIPQLDHTISWRHDLSCSRRAGTEAASGGNGARGSDAGRITAYVTKVRSASSGPMLFIVLEEDGKSRFVVAPESSKFVIYANGGHGGTGAAGGDGGHVDLVIDERFTELWDAVSWEALGGRGAPGTPNGNAGSGSKKPGDVLLSLIARTDLPKGIAMLDSPVKAPRLPKKRVTPPPPPRPPVASKPSPPPPPSGARSKRDDIEIDLPLLDPFDGRSPTGRPPKPPSTKPPLPKPPAPKPHLPLHIRDNDVLGGRR